MGRECGLSRLWKDVGEGEAGPMAPNNLWVGSDVHVDIPGGDRRNRKRQGIAAAPSVHKAADCPGGEHRHDRFDYCHPEERKHRGQGKADEPKRRFPPSREVNQKWQVVFNRWQDIRLEGDPAEVEALDERMKQLRALFYLAKEWERSDEGEAWANRKKVKRAKGEGLKSREHYEEKAAALEKKFAALRDEHESLYEQYKSAGGWKEREPYYEKLHENVKQQKAARNGLKRAKSMATLGFAREWTGIIQKIAGGVKPHITAIRAGGRSFAEYDLETGIISLSHSALRVLEKVRNDPDLLWKEDPNRPKNRFAFAVSSLVHEFLHSVNSAKGFYRKNHPTEVIEEGLTEAIANRMVARADVLSNLLGSEVEKGITAVPDHPKYIMAVNTMEYLAELAARKHGGEPEWFLGKWKFQDDPRVREEAILDDAGVAAEDGYSTHPWDGLMKEAREKLPQMKEARLAQRENKAFQGTVQKVLDAAWSVMGFVFKNDTWPPATPAPTGGGGGGPASAASSLAPSNMDVRHTGSPPKGVRWQKLPRQGGTAIGGAGAGAVDAAVEKPRKRC